MPIHLSADDGFDFAIRCLLNGAAYGMADAGEVFAATENIGVGDSDAWFDGLTALGARIEAEGDASAARGHLVSASNAYLRAANYRYAGFWYVLDTRAPERWADAWRTHRRCFDRAMQFRAGVQPLEIPHRVVTLRGYTFRADVIGPAPLLVVQGGLGAPMSDALMVGALDAVARGWHAVTLDGPGQGWLRVVDHTGPVDDWAPVVGSTLAAVLASPILNVDPERIAIIGVGDGAVFAAQAAARDARIAALVCDPGVLRPVDGALGQLPDAVVAEWHASGDGDALAHATQDACDADPAVAFTVAKLTEQWPHTSLGTVLARLTAWDLTPLLADVGGPVLITDPDAAMSYPGQSSELAGLLGSRAARIEFTTVEGAGLDCEIGAPLLRAQRIGDWLDDAVGHSNQPNGRGDT